MFNNKKNKDKITLTKPGAFLICLLFFLTISVFGLVSAFDSDKTVSEIENRTLKSLPAVSSQNLFDGSFTGEFDEYYADTFPLREMFLSVNKKISSVFSKTSSKNDMVIVEKSEKDDFAGQNID